MFILHPVHEFEVVVKLTGVDNRHILNYVETLTKCGCQDALIETEGTEIHVSFQRHAKTYEAAVLGGLKSILDAHIIGATISWEN